MFFFSLFVNGHGKRETEDLCEYGNLGLRSGKRSLRAKLAGLRFARIWQERSLVNSEKRERP